MKLILLLILMIFHNDQCGQGNPLCPHDVNFPDTWLGPMWSLNSNGENFIWIWITHSYSHGQNPSFSVSLRISNPPLNVTVTKSLLKFLPSQEAIFWGLWTYGNRMNKLWARLADPKHIHFLVNPLDSLIVNPHSSQILLSFCKL